MINVIVVLLHPLRRPETPTTSAGISSRMAKLSFSAPFLREMRAIALAKNYVENSRFPFTGLERRLARKLLRFSIGIDKDTGR
jgi:NTE family protein